MTQKELLTIAKSKYPIGTKLIPINKNLMNGDPAFVVVEQNDHYLSRYRDWSSKKKDAIWVDVGKWRAVIYDRGTWAEIIN